MIQLTCDGFCGRACLNNIPVVITNANTEVMPGVDLQYLGPGTSVEFRPGAARAKLRLEIEGPIEMLQSIASYPVEQWYPNNRDIALTL